MLAVVTLRGELLQSVQILGTAEEGGEEHSADEAHTTECTSMEEFENPAACATKEPNPILPEPREIVWGFGSFLLLALIMRVALYPKVKGMMEAREAKIDGDIAAAETARTSVAAEQQAYADRIAEARAESSRIIDAARTEVEAERSAKLGALNTELAQLRSAATAEIEAAVSSARASFNDAVADLAVGAASKVVSKPVDRSAALPVITEYVGSASGGAR